MSGRLYDRNFLIAFVAQTAFTISNSLLAHYSRWVEFLGGDVSDIGRVNAVSAIVGLLARPFLAPWIDRIGPRACWCAAGAVVAAAMLSNLTLVDVGWLLYASRSISAVGIAVVFASGLTYIAQSTPPERRTEAIGALGAGGFVGLLIGPWLGDLILDRGRRTLADFHWYFAATACGVGLSMLLVAALRPCPKSLSPETSRRRPLEFLRSVRLYWPGPVVFVTVAFGVCMTVPFVFLAVFVDIMPGVRVWWFFVAYATTGLAVRLGLRGWPDQFGVGRVLVAGMLLFAAGMWSFRLTTADMPLLILLPGVACGAAHGLTFHSMVSLVLAPFPESARGAGSTLSLMGIDAGAFFGAQILAHVADKFGFTLIFDAVAVCCVCSVGIFLLGGRRPIKINPSHLI